MICNGFTCRKIMVQSVYILNILSGQYETMTSKMWSRSPNTKPIMNLLQCYINDIYMYQLVQETSHFCKKFNICKWAFDLENKVTVTKYRSILKWSFSLILCTFDRKQDKAH